MSEKRFFIKESTLDGIGNAIREVTGTTEKIPILDFESTIRGLSSGSGGGGSLPAGLYCEQITTPLPKAYNHAHFTLNGELYLLMRDASGSGSYYTCYKFEGGQYVQVTTSTKFYAYPSINIEHNGKIHFFGSNDHAYFDGTTIVDGLKLPQSEDYHSMFIHNGRLYYMYYRDRSMYYWDDETCTWNADSTVTVNYNSMMFSCSFEYKGNWYMYDSGIIYKLVGDRFEPHGSLPSSASLASGKFEVIGNYLYVAKAKWLCGNELYKINLELLGGALEPELVGYIPSANAVSLYTYAGQLIAEDSVGSSYQPHMILHEIEA